MVDGTEGVSPWRLLREHLQPYAMDESPYGTGLENQLLARARRARRKGRLGPADLYRLSLELNQGNRLNALLTVHDAIKKTGRGLQVGEATPDDTALFRASIAPGRVCASSATSSWNPSICVGSSRAAR